MNPLQGAYFEALETSGMAIEVVGDPKQSIYGFRNADVGVFRRALANGEEQPALVHTRRHARVVARFLNHMTTTLAAGNLGFGQQEAPPVETKGVQEEAEGRVELHWVAGEEAIGELRQTEARVLAGRLKSLHKLGYAYGDMAVLARSYAGLRHVEAALLNAGLPYVLLQGRGYFERIEVRDLYHALRVGLDPVGLSLGAWLRGPYAQLDTPEVHAVLQSDEPLDTLAENHRAVFERLELITSQVRGTPLAALKFLIRRPFIAGKRYVDFLETRARENVDALLFTVAQQPPGDIELLLGRLDLLSRQTDAGDVPQSGEGIQLLTVHRSKGLEWRVAAVFDLGRMNYHQPQDLYVHPQSGHIRHKDADGFLEARAFVKAREDAESYRLLYVAASRARDVLLLTGSVKNDKPDGFMRALTQMNLGADSQPYARADFVLQTHPHAAGSLDPGPRRAAELLSAAPYIDRSFRPHEHPPVSSPSRLKSEAGFEHEPLPFSDPEEGERLPGRATTVGTLTHYAISQDWRAANPAHRDNLRAQEVMFPYTPDEQDDILNEVSGLLTHYEALLGNGIPALDKRSHDYPEIGMALPVGTTVWQGIIDRLYCAGGVWYLEDYKTDQEIVPEKYHFQLAVYFKAIQEVRGITPRVQLVFLREKKIVVIDAAVMQDALAQKLPMLT